MAMMMVLIFYIIVRPSAPEQADRLGLSVCLSAALVSNIIDYYYSARVLTLILPSRGG